MKKNIRLFLGTVLCLLLLLGLPVISQARGDRMVDNARVLSEEQREKLEQKLAAISEEQQFDVVILTENSIHGRNPISYAEDYFDYNGYGYGSGRDGIILLLAFDDRDWGIATTGSGIDYFTDVGTDYLTEQFLFYLSEGNYEKGFQTFADWCEKYVVEGKKGNIYDKGNLPKKPLGILSYIISAIVGVAGATGITFGLKSQLKSVRYKRGAEDYVQRGSFNLTGQQDLFLYSHVTRVRRQTSQSSGRSGGGGTTIHTGSSGTSHGGASGKF